MRAKQFWLPSKYFLLLVTHARHAVGRHLNHVISSGMPAECFNIGGHVARHALALRAFVRDQQVSTINRGGQTAREHME